MNIRICFVFSYIFTLDLTCIGRMQLSCKSIELSVICSNSSLKSNLKTRSVFHEGVYDII